MSIFGPLRGRHDLSGHAHLGQRGGVRGHGLAVDQQHGREGDLRAGRTGEPVDLDDVADSDLLLTATGADDRVHRGTPCFRVRVARAFPGHAPRGRRTKEGRAARAEGQGYGSVTPRANQGVRRACSRRPWSGHEPHDPIGDQLGLREVVGDVNRRRPQPVEQRPDVGRQSVPQVPVEGAEGLIEEQQARARRQRPREGHPLGLAPGQGRHGSVSVVGELDHREQLGHPRRALRTRDPRRRQAVRDVAGDVQVREEQGVLEHQPEPPTVRRGRDEVDAVPEDRPRVGSEQPGDHPEQRGLARPAGAQATRRPRAVPPRARRRPGAGAVP